MVMEVTIDTRRIVCTIVVTIVYTTVMNNGPAAPPVIIKINIDNYGN